MGSAESGEAPPRRPVLFLGNQALPPISFLENGQPAGVVVDLARALAQRMPRPVELRLMNWADAQEQVRDGRADALLQVNPTPERMGVFMFSEPLLASEFSVFTTPDHQTAIASQGLAGLRVGGEQQGLPMQLMKADPSILTTAIPDFAAGFRMVLDGRLDAVVADAWVGSYVLAHQGIQGIVLAGAPISRSQSAIAVRKDDRILLQEINAALASLRRDGTYDRILASWRPTEVVFKTREQVRLQAWVVTGVSLALGLSLAGVALLTREVRRRRRAEEALRESEHRFRLALGHAPVSVAIQDRDLKYIWAYNQRTATQEEIIGHTDRDLFLPQEAARLEALKRTILAEDRPRQAQLWLDRPGGRMFLEVHFEPIHDADGHTIGIGITTLDLTALKRSEEAVRTIEGELRERDRRRTDFLALLSHELRNPLAPIRYSLYLLEHAAQDSEQARSAREVMERQTRHLTRLIDDLLDVTRITRDKIHLQLERLDLVELTRRTVDDHRSVFQEQGVRLETELPGEPVWVDGDRTRLAQALGNLLTNAAKFTPQGGWTRVRVEPFPDGIRITVADDGCGIDPEQIPRMFDPFTQADRTLNRSAGGLGLGLALVKGLVELHGGSVACTSGGPGQGSTFQLQLPPAPVPGTEPQEVAPPLAGPRRILLVEDQADGAASLRQVLEGEGHTVELACDGAEGLAMAGRFGPEVVLCDLGLPVLDGFEVARALRADARFDQVRLIAVSGYTQPEDRSRAREAGFDAHLPKPLDLDRLNRELKVHGKGPGPQAQFRPA